MDGGDERRRFDGFKWALVAACAVLALVVVLLARQNTMLKRELLAGPAVELKAGDQMDEIVLIDDPGQGRRLELRGPTLLLVFSTQCPACREVLPVWRELAALAGPDGTEVIGLQTDPAPADSLESYPVHAIDPARSPGMERIPFVPATILLDAAGTVRRIWFGPLSDEETQELAGLMRG